MSYAPFSIATTAPATIAVPAQQWRYIAVKNTDATNSINVKINGDSVGWQLDPGEGKTNRFAKGITAVQVDAVAGSPTFKLELSA